MKKELQNVAARITILHGQQRDAMDHAAGIEAQIKSLKRKVEDMANSL